MTPIERRNQIRDQLIKARRTGEAVTLSQLDVPHVTVHEEPPRPPRDRDGLLATAVALCLIGALVAWLAWGLA